MGSGPLAAPAESPGLLRVGSWRRLADGPGKRGLAAGADPRRPPALPDGHGHRGHHESDDRWDARVSGHGLGRQAGQVLPATGRRQIPPRTSRSRIRRDDRDDRGLCGGDFPQGRRLSQAGGGRADGAMVPAAVRRMKLAGYATVEGTRRYRDRLVAAGAAHAGHFREGLGGMALSTIGIGRYLGKHDDATDELYQSAIQQAVKTGCNVIESAINYRCQRSERTIGRALAELIKDGTCRRDEVLIATKGGFIPYDGAPPRDGYAYVQKTFITPGLFNSSDVVADCHCMTPTYLRNQIDTSLANLGLACLDVYYLHNPEIQLEQVTRDEFMKRMRAAIEALEAAVAQGKLRVYGTATWEGYRVSPKARGHLSLEALVRLGGGGGGEGPHLHAIQMPANIGMPEALAAKTQSFNGATVPLLVAAKALDIYVMISAPILQGRLARGLPADLHQALGEGTDAQRALQFVRSTPGIGTALVGMKQADHVRENLTLARLAPLSPDQIAKVFA